MYIHRNNALTESMTDLDRALHLKVRAIMANTWKYALSLEIGGRLSFECHSIAKAISMAFPELKMVSGSYLGLEWREAPGQKTMVKVVCCPHSWLVTPDEAIIDPYPVSVDGLEAMLVVTKGMYAPFGTGLYRPNNASVFTKEIWRRSQVLFKLIQKANKGLKIK